MRDVIFTALGFTLACAVFAVTLQGYDVRPRDSNDNYYLSVELSDGNEYTLDHKLTRSDCYSRMSDLFGFNTPIKGVSCRKD